ncbi:MAG: hypothetical protein ABIV47_10785, partial [Roseiflexaceae bacterium]
MSSTNATELERTLLRSGDDLYRLALLLSTDESGAQQALIKAVRRLANSAAALDQPALIAALIQSLPPERKRVRQRRLPAWAYPRAASAARAELLAALAALPRAQRFALGLTMLRSFESTQATALFSDEGLFGAADASGQASELVPAEADPTRALVRDALLALAPIVIPTVSPALLDSAGAPEDCRPTRTALALNDPALHHDPALRGHLALCSACRAAEHAWHSLSVAVEEALRGALRDTRLPPALADQLLAASLPTAATAGWALLSSSRARLVLVALPVLALIAFLVWPRGVPPAPTASAPPLAQAPEARELVRRAQDQLYLPPAGQGVWHGRYEVQWAFADDSTALLTGDAWIDSSSGRHRIQLVHHSGGGPYEFELADGVSSANYAISSIYQPSIYPLTYLPNRVKVAVTPEEQTRMLAMRFESGAWGIADDYLRQAEHAELRTWGRQRAGDGALLDLVSFAGTSPLSLPADAPNATSSRVTVLLAIDEASGRLREVRELIGPTGSEQTTRITWRQVSEEWINDDQAIGHIFDPLEAWNGVGSFTEIGKLVDPALPLTRTEALTALVDSYDLGWTGLLMPSSAPPGTSAAFLLDYGQQPIPGNRPDSSTWLTFVYLAPGKRLEISTSQTAIPSLVGGEIVLLDQRQMLVRPSNGRRYQVQFDHNVENTLGSATSTTQVAAFGYTRAELIDVLRSLGPPTLAAYTAQARLFADPGPRDSA